MTSRVITIGALAAAGAAAGIAARRRGGWSAGALRVLGCAMFGRSVEFHIIKLALHRILQYIVSVVQGLEVCRESCLFLIRGFRMSVRMQNFRHA